MNVFALLRGGVGGWGAAQVQDKLAELARIHQGEPDAGEIAAREEAQNQRNIKACVYASVFLCISGCLLL